MFAILGPLEVKRGATPVRIGGPRQRALLALLLCHANQVVSRDRLIDELLSDQPAGPAERMLRVQVSRLRKVLADGDAGAEPRLLARPPGYVLRVTDGELDLHAFDHRAASGQRALADGDPDRAAALLREAESLWRGRPLADLESEPFAGLEVQRLEALRLGVVEDRIEAELATGRHTALCSELGQLVAEHPLRETTPRAADARPVPQRSAGRRAGELPRRPRAAGPRAGGRTGPAAEAAPPERSSRRTRPWTCSAPVARPGIAPPSEVPAGQPLRRPKRSPETAMPHPGRRRRHLADRACARRRRRPCRARCARAASPPRRPRPRR